MIINGLQVDNFGIWNDFTIGELPDDVTVFYGPNEAGKSTLMNFIRTILFGFSPDKCQRFVTGSLPQPRGRMGGRLRLSGYEGQFQVRRYADELDPLASPGDVRVTTVDGGRVGAHKLASLLSGIDETIFNNVFCVGMSEIQQLSSLNDTQAAQFLYSLSTGTDRVSLVDVMRQLRTARTRLVGNGEPGLLTKLIRRRDEKRRTIEQLGRLTENWGQLRSELTALDQEIKRLETQRDRLKKQSRTLEVAAGLRPKWLRRKKLAAEIAALGPAPELPTGIFERLRSVDERILQRRREWEVLKQRREALAESAKELNVSDGLQRNSARVNALLDQRVWISTLDDEVRRLESRAEEIEFEIQAELEKLGVAPAADGISVVPQIDAHALSALRAPARLVKLSKKRLDAAKREAAEHKAEANRIGQQITSQLGGKAEWLDERDRNDVTQLMEKTGSVAAKLRRHGELRRAAAELSDGLEAIERRRKRLLEHQFLPRPVLVALATVFAIGSILLLSAIFGTGTIVSESRRGFVLLLGAIATGTAVGWKFLLDRTHQGALLATESERRDLAGQLADAEDEIARIEEKLPAGRSLARLHDEDGLGDLEQLMPLDTQRRQALELAAAAEKRAIEVATSMKEVRLQWEKALAALGLPTRLSPGQVRQLAGRAGNLTFLRRQREDTQDHLERARRELATVHGRIVDLMTEAHVQPTTQRPLEQLEQLNGALREQQKQVAKRNEIRRQIRKLGRQENRLTTGIHRLEHKRTTIFASAHATDEDDLRRLEELRQQVTSLVQQHDNLNEDITAALRASADEAQVRRQLENTNGEEQQKRLQQTQQDALRAEKQLQELLHQRGELTQQLKTLVQDRQLPEAHIKLAIIERKLRDGFARWKELSATTHLLRRVYKRYEKDRQPETLQHASEFLHRMTGGRYARIWTPLAEDVLLIDDSQGHSLPIEVLSRGTREQVFLSLRLALVSGYARRGVRMPMVLDDVLVNFDVDRTVAAAEVLTEFARSGHQMFIFTCHDHIVRVFQDLDVELRDLPQREATLALPEALPTAAPVPGERETIDTKRTHAAPAAAATGHGIGSFLGDMMLPSVLPEATATETDTSPNAAYPLPPALEPAVLEPAAPGLSASLKQSSVAPVPPNPPERLFRSPSTTAASSSPAPLDAARPEQLSAGEQARGLPVAAATPLPAQDADPIHARADKVDVAEETAIRDQQYTGIATPIRSLTPAVEPQVAARDVSDAVVKETTVEEDTLKTEPAATDVAEEVAVETASLASAAVETDIVETETVEAESVGPETVEPDTVKPDVVETEEVGLDEPADAAVDFADTEAADADVATGNEETNVEAEDVTDEDEHDDEDDYEYEYEYVEVDDDADDELDDELADEDTEYEYVDEDGNPLDEGAEELADDEEYEWFEVDDDETKLGDEAA